jgi:hypothetical protein
MSDSTSNQIEGLSLHIDRLTPETINYLICKLNPETQVKSVAILSRAACGDGLASTADRVTLSVEYEQDCSLPNRIVLKTILLHPVLRLGLPAILSLSRVTAILEKTPLIGKFASKLLFLFIGVFQKYFPQAPDAMYEVESRFYSEIRPGLNIESPNIFGAAYDANTRHFGILMEDLSEAKAHFPTALESQSLETVKSTLKTMAVMHARFWNSPDLEKELAWVPTRFQGGMYPIFDGIGYELIRYQVENNSFKKELLSPIGKTVKELWEGLWQSQELLLQGHETLLHGDTHVGNTYVLPGEKGGLLDFQLLVKGNPLIDVSYYIITALDADSRIKHQHELLQYYLDQLKELGIEAMTFDSAWQDYRLSSLWGLVIGWLITPSVNYGEDITSANIERTAKAVVDLDVYSLLETA